MSEKRNDTQFWNLIIGIVIVLTGGYFLANNFGYVPDWFRWRDLWPLAIIAVGLWFIFFRKEGRG